MNCPKCGKPMIPGAYFCGYCGEKFVLPQQGEHQFPVQAHRPKRKILFSLGIIALCIIVCADVLLIRKVRTNYADEGRTTVSQEITTSFDTAASNEPLFEKIGTTLKNLFSDNMKDSSSEYDGAHPEEVRTASQKQKTPSSPYGGTMLGFSYSSEGQIMDNCYELVPLWGNDSIYRFQILSITFYETTDDVPPNAWDISAQGSVYAWVTEADCSNITDEKLLTALRNYTKTGKLYDFHIASDGIIFAPLFSTYLFSYFTSVQSIRFNNVFNTSNVESMDCMFLGCSSLTELDVSDFDTSNVVNMAAMFRECEALKELDVSGFDTSKATDMGGMFFHCCALEKLDVSQFDTSNVMYMCIMFDGCESLEELDVSSFNTANVTDMSGMFGLCTKVKGLNVSGFDTSNVTNMTTMFQGCQNLTELDLSAFNTSNVTNMLNMFATCDRLKKLDLSGFDTSNVERFSGMFQWCYSLEALNLTGWDTAAMKDGQNALAGCPAETQERWGYLFN